ncbi:carbon-nitrogen hydrolase [Daldinia decipiens]|uniref:carbon-nitrogen hydrolase n=1 Tax=Daldinia decipiens TaxID=326647 RepID=UPI0020C37583|nr:carbon-nitrogen hydrolase [Daldinia decipiens]KAI1657506.1 carbon-nitrogen hydrolase [Daldinia decipiens]
MAKAAIGQICSSNSMAHNLEQCVKLVGQAAAAGAKVLFLPEASDYIGSSAQESLSLAKPLATSPFVSGLRSAAAKHKLAVHVGIHVPVSVKPSLSPSNPVLSSVPHSEDPDSIPSAVSVSASTSTPSASASASASASEQPSTREEEDPSPQTKLYNRTILINPDGTLHPTASYDKLHLFDYPDASLRESTTTQAGSAFTPPFDTPVGRIGSLICFDLRFPEPALHLTTPSPSSSSSNTTTTPSPPAQILLYPSAFTIPTGLAHWETLLRARAIETQSWVIAAAQVGTHNPRLSPRTSYGRSMVVDPWGRVMLELKGVRDKDGDGGGYEVEDGAVGQLGLVHVDLGVWDKVREQMPLVRRTDVYPKV